MTFGIDGAVRDPDLDVPVKEHVSIICSESAAEDKEGKQAGIAKEIRRLKYPEEITPESAARNSVSSHVLLIEELDWGRYAPLQRCRRLFEEFAAKSEPVIIEGLGARPNGSRVSCTCKGSGL